MLHQDNLAKWTPLLEAVIGLFELPEDTSVPDDEHFIDVEDIAGKCVKRHSNLSNQIN